MRPEGDTALVARGSVPYVGYVALATRTAVGQHALLIAAGLLILRRPRPRHVAVQARPGNGLVTARHPRRDRVVTPGGPRLLRPPPTTVVQRLHHHHSQGAVTPCSSPTRRRPSRAP